MTTVAVRLSIFWFLFLGGMGVFMPYFADHLSEVVGLSRSRMGIVLAMIPLAGVLGQPVFGQISDRTGSRRQALAIVSLVAAAAFLILGTLRGFVPLLFGTAFMSFHSSAILPMLTATSMASLADDGQKSFSQVRTWGTVGFLVGAFGGPWLFREHMFVVTAVAMVLCAATAFSLPPRGDVALRSAPGMARRLLGHPPVRRILVFSFVAFLVLQGPILHFPVILRAHGGNEQTIAWTWLGMLLVEIPLIAVAGKLLRILGPRGLLAVGIGVEGARWFASGVVEELWLLQVIQIVHGVGVTGVLLGIPFYLEASMPRAMRSTGQAIASVAGAGCGGMASSMLLGFSFEEYGVDGPLMVGGVIGLALAGCVTVLLPTPYRQG